MSELRRSNGSAAVEFVLISAPLVFTFLAVANLSWSAFERAQLGTIANRAAAVGALADSDTEDALSFARQQARLWLGREVSVTITKDRFTHVTLGIDGIEVNADALSEVGSSGG